MAQTVFAKWGNSFAIRIPEEIVRSLKISEGVRAEVRMEGDRLVVQPASTDKTSLEVLLAGRDCHYELTREDKLWDDIKPAGNEIW